jgi:hypothetical protein
MINERILLGLRSRGVALEVLRGPDRRGLEGDRGALVHDLLARGLAKVAAGTLTLTPQGFVVSDEIARRLMVG